MTTPIRIVDGPIATDELGRPVAALPIRYVEGPTATNEVGQPVDALQGEIVDSAVVTTADGRVVGSVPARVVAGQTTLNEVGTAVPVVPVWNVGEPSGPWYEAPEFDDWAAVGDFKSNRYALPVLDEGGQPILTRDEHGRFPKREVPAADFIVVQRYAIAPVAGRTVADRMRRDRATASWAALAANEPRIENWTGTAALYVEPNRRSNCVPDAESLPGAPRYADITRWDSEFRVTWIGNADLLCASDLGSEHDVLLPALSDDPEGLNWGYLPATAPENPASGPVTFSAVGGGVVHSICTDQMRGAGDVGPPTFIPTTAGTVNNRARVDCSPEHVRLSAAVMALINHTDQPQRMRSGTIIIDQHQFTAPSPGNKRTILGGGTSGSPRNTINVSNAAGAYSFQNDTSYAPALLTLNADEEAIRSRCKIGLSVNDVAATRRRRFAVTGVGVVSTAVDGNFGINGSNAFFFNSTIMTGATTTPQGAGGTGGFHAFLWSPEEMSEADLLEAVNAP